MIKRHGSLRVMLAMLGLVAGMLVLQAALPAPAQARCNGVGNEVTSTLNISGAAAVSEVPLSNTCNDNNLYRSRFKSNYSGWRASVWIQNGGVWAGYFGPYGTGWENLSYTDNNSNSLIHFCLDDGTHWYCGWGRNYTIASGVTHNYYGNNFGF